MKATQERRRGGNNGSPHNGSPVEPHPLANELSDDAGVHTNQPIDTSDPAVSGEAARYRSGQRDQALTPAQRSVGKQMVAIVGLVVVVGIIVSAALLRDWTFIYLGLLLFVPFMILLLAPVWLAATTKKAQDATVREQTGAERDWPRKNEPERNHRVRTSE